MYDPHHSTHYQGNPALHQTIRRIALVLALIGWMIVVALPVYSQAGPEPSQRALTLEDRIGYQRAVEEVYWRHRIWPKQNGRRKPDLEEVMPEEAIRAKVEDYLSKSQALAVYWQRPITGEQLQAEMDRMARQTKQPAMLKELWATLGNDPHVIAECLARPVLVNRLIRNWYAHDERYQGELKARAEADLRAYGTASQMRQMSGEYYEAEWVKGVKGGRRWSQTAATDQVTLSPEEWEVKVRELAQVFGRGWSRDARPGEGAGPADVRSELDHVSVGELSSLDEDDDRFYVTTVLEKGNEHLKLATVEWKKDPFDTGWGRVPDEMTEPVATVSPSPPGDPEPSYQYRLPVIDSASSSCADDTWTGIPAPPDPRRNHTAVWTGSEMIVWGGYSFDPDTSFNSGGRYDPATDTWTPTSTVNAPSARRDHTAVWTGSEMIIWGGASPTAFNTGGRYDPATDTWTATATDNAPSARSSHTAVWTGSEMIVWGGISGPTTFNTGGRYDPATDTWTPTSSLNAPSIRYLHRAVWTGSEMIVWGGASGPTAFINTGGRYDPASDTWTATATDNAPSARSSHTAVWTGSEMIVWGGISGTTVFNTGGRYDPDTDSWTPTSTLNAPSPRELHTAVWTGSEMIVWGGVPGTNTGGRYDPATDTWTATATDNAPSARGLHTAVWTGSEMIVWGGFDVDNIWIGGRYDPASDTWTPTGTLNAPRARYRYTAVWTGSEMIVWGGATGPTAFNTGGRYDPATDTWTATATSNAPSARNLHTAVWTGGEMIVWGGFPSTNTGGRYDPASDTWTATATDNAPSARGAHTAVWTGSEMIVWGGSSDSGVLNTGGRYDPGSDSWTPTSTLNAPSVRVDYTAVWTGNEMVVWGGTPLPYTNTGGRYDPTTDSWTPTSTLNAPDGRIDHTAVWTGSEMIVWGGSGGFPTLFNSGGRYDPTTDSWTPTSTLNAPSPRELHTAVWTGSEMIVWGGSGGLGIFPIFFNSGGRYDPATDSWTPTSTLNAPSPRELHRAVWTGSEMIVWGGLNSFSSLNTGGRYCRSAGDSSTMRPFQ